MANNKVFIISDIHFPFHHKKAYKKVLELIKLEKPDVVIQIGDLLDQYVFSKYTRKPSITPDQDVKKGLALAHDMWKKIRKLRPKAKLYQILGNHDIRLNKRISEKLPELADFFGSETLYVFPGVLTMKSDRDFLKIDGVTYCHGWLSKSIDHAKYFNSPTVHGHRHRPTIETDGPIWSMDVGYLADKTTVPLQYTASKYTKWTKACGIVYNGRPRLVFID